MDMDKDYGDKDITPEEALELCLVRMEAGSGLPLADGVRKTVGDSAIEKFKKNHGEWPTYGSKVLRAARKIGEYSEDFAVFDAEMNGTSATKVELQHVREAIRVVKTFCDARVGLRFKWCPEP